MSSMGGHRWRRWGVPKPFSSNDEQQQIKDPFIAAEQRLSRVKINKRAWRKNQDLSQLDTLIDGARGHALGLDKQYGSAVERSEAWLYALALQAPRAAVAQEAMDAHPHGYHNKQHRLYELIDFNDAFDAAILALPREYLPQAEVRIRRLADMMCQKAGTRCFSERQYHALTHGLSREIAVYLGAQKEGFEAEMTSRREDAFGIDLCVLDPKSLKTVSIDIKTRSAYYYRIKQLLHEGRLSEEGFLMADRNGFTAVDNGHGDEKKRVVTWRIDHEVLGDVVNFEFQDTTRLGETLRAITLRYGERV